MSGRITILESATRVSSSEFVELMTDTSCSICGLTAEEMDCWDHDGIIQQRRLILGLLGNVEARADESVMIHDTLKRLVCLGRRVADGWEFLPFEKGHRPAIDSLLGKGRQ